MNKKLLYLSAFCFAIAIAGGYAVGFQHGYVYSKMDPDKVKKIHGYSVINADSIQYRNGVKAKRTWPK